MKHTTFEIYGDFNFGDTTVGIIATVEYAIDRDGGLDYLDIVSMKIYNEETNCDDDATPEQMVKFQEEHWSYLENKCRDHERDLREMYAQQWLDNQEEIADRKYHEMRDKEALCKTI